MGWFPFAMIDCQRDPRCTVLVRILGFNVNPNHYWTRNRGRTSGNSNVCHKMIFLDLDLASFEMIQPRQKFRMRWMSGRSMN